MNVAQLIQILQDMPPELEVAYATKKIYTNNMFDVRQIDDVLLLETLKASPEDPSHCVALYHERWPQEYFSEN